MIIVVAVAYGGDTTLNRTLPSWKSVLDGRSGWEILIWDNSPNKVTASTIKTFLPSAEVYSSGENIGFAGGVNRIIERRAPSDYFVLLNLDIYVTEEWAREVEDVSNLRDICIAWPLNTRGAVTAGVASSVFLNFRDRTVSSRRRLIGPSGGAAGIPSGIFNTVGPFDESFFAWGEDADFAFRLVLNGYETRLGRSVMTHEGGHSISSHAIRAIRDQSLCRNRVVCWRRYTPPVLAPLWAVVYLLSALVLILKGLHTRTVAARFRGVVEGYRSDEAKIGAPSRLSAVQVLSLAGLSSPRS